ncbi:hypothetical protein ABG768_023953, partial [Culter alburnus]
MLCFNAERRTRTRTNTARKRHGPINTRLPSSPHTSADAPNRHDIHSSARRTKARE